MNADQAIALFVEGTELFETGDIEKAATFFERVVAFQASLKAPGDLESNEGSLSMMMSASNLAIALQALGHYERMLQTTTRLVSLVQSADEVNGDPDAKHPDNGAGAYNLHAIALHHTGDLRAALAACKEAIHRAPDYANAHYECACIAVALDDCDGAIAYVAQALDCGSDRADILADADLAPLLDVPQFQHLLDDAQHLDRLQRRLLTAVKLLNDTAPTDPGRVSDWLADDSTTLMMQEMLPIAEELLVLSDLGAAPTRDRGDGVPIINGTRCERPQRAVLETLLQCGRLWHAIPFLNLLGQFGIPNLTAADARNELGLTPDTAAS